MREREDNNNLQALLEQGCQHLGLVADAALPAYLHYIELLNKWNKTYNLTAIREPEMMLSRHVLDSLSVLPYIEGKRCLDIGTGAGLPGMVLALAQPERHWTLLDSNQKKLRFLRHVLVELELNNVELVHSRIEAFATEQDFDTIICRAFAPLGRMLQQAQRFLTGTNQLLAMKGKQAEEEIAGLGEHKFLIRLNELALPGQDPASILVQIRRAV